MTDPDDDTPTEEAHMTRKAIEAASGRALDEPTKG